MSKRSWEEDISGSLDIEPTHKEQVPVEPNVVTPPKAKVPKLSPQDSSNSARRNIFGEETTVNQARASETELPSTQEPDYEVDAEAGVPRKSEVRYAILEDVFIPNATAVHVTKPSSFSIGRDPSCDLTLNNPCVSTRHCELLFNGDGACTLKVTSEKRCCWISSMVDENGWHEILPNKTHIFVSDSHIRLQEPSKDESTKNPEQEFRVYIAKFNSPTPGSNSFDSQYLSLLEAISREGKPQQNKKGNSRTLRRNFTLTIDLSDGKDRYLLPMTTLRSLYGGRAALLEAIWYLRGEDHVRFLQKNKCHFWDKQCNEQDGWLGFNYGLLTNFPLEDKKTKNQLEVEVISRLCKGQNSRNMVCSLLKPGEPTSQVACTTSIQFSVSTNKEGAEALDLTINQRSSDAIVGLPHDVVVWAIILHLVRREVKLRTKGGRMLLAGNIIFSIAAGGAHVYDLNSEAFEKLRGRKPIKGIQPCLAVQDEEENQNLSSLDGCKDMFSLSDDYDPKDFRIRGYTSFHKAIRVRQAV